MTMFLLTRLIEKAPEEWNDSLRYSVQFSSVTVFMFHAVYDRLIQIMTTALTRIV